MMKSSRVTHRDQHDGMMMMLQLTTWNSHFQWQARQLHWVIDAPKMQ